jgi:hypothetical protein
MQNVQKCESGRGSDVHPFFRCEFRMDFNWE